MLRNFCRSKILAMILSSFFVCSQTFADNDSAIRVKWGYKGNIGPEKWSQLSPDFVICAKGKLQSPINILKKVLTETDHLNINYVAAPLNVVNDGVTDLLIGREHIMINDGHSIQVNFHAKVKEIITLDGHDYHLVQLHIHTPSEHQWHGQSFPLEIHLVHQSDDGRIAVIGVFGKGGSEHKELKKIVDHIPQEKGKDIEIQNETINPNLLLPLSRDYFRYSGSLTTPPCYEGVQWIVMANPISVSPSQIVKLREAVSGANARPVQPLNNRKVFSITTAQIDNKNTFLR